MPKRAFPVVFASSVRETVAFYEILGFARFFALPPGTDEPGYVGLRRDATEIAVVDAAWPTDRYDKPVGAGVRFEMFVYVDDVDDAVSRVRLGTAGVLRDPDDMPWGERVAYVADPDGNPVALAAALTA